MRLSLFTLGLVFAPYIIGFANGCLNSVLIIGSELLMDRKVISKLRNIKWSFTIPRAPFKMI